MSQTAMDHCASSELKELDDQLDAALAQERAILTSALVDESQSAFEKYKQTECGALSSANAGGTIQPLVETTFEIGRTVQRIQQVRTDDAVLPKA